MSEAVAIGASVEGTVRKIFPYGMLVELPGGTAGLAHISEIADAYIKDIADYFQIGDQVTVKILRTDERGRYHLSVRQAGVIQEKERAAPPREVVSIEPPPPAAFEEKLKRYLRESQEKLHDLKRNREGKLGKPRK